MFEVKSYKRTLIGAVVLTIGFILILCSEINHHKVETNTSETLLTFITLIALLATTIYYWIRATKKYIDYAIEENGKDQQIINIAIEEKIKQLKNEETKE